MSLVGSRLEGQVTRNDETLAVITFEADHPNDEGASDSHFDWLGRCDL